ncbi:MAG: hypothetical protein AAGI68_11860 [Planctomycetota bacterium]
MSAEHDAYIPLIDPVMHAYGVEHSMPNAQVRSLRGERADWFGLVGRTVQDAFGERRTVFAGDCVVVEVKRSLGDLRKDAGKPWREGRGLGSWRLFLLAEDGGLRPEHVDDGNGWGVMWARTGGGVELVRMPERMHEMSVNHSAEKLIAFSMGADVAAGDMVLNGLAKANGVKASRVAASLGPQKACGLPPARGSLSDDIAQYVIKHGRMMPREIPQQLRAGKSVNKIVQLMHGHPEVAVVKDAGIRWLVPAEGAKGGEA